jgi:hypothetical protein
VKHPKYETLLEQLRRDALTPKELAKRLLRRGYGELDFGGRQAQADDIATKS